MKINIHNARARQLDRMKMFYRTLKTCTDRSTEITFRRWLEEAEQNYTLILEGVPDLWTAAKTAIDKQFAWTESREACLAECVSAAIDFCSSLTLKDLLSAMNYVVLTNSYATDRYHIDHQTIASAVIEANSLNKPKFHDVARPPGGFLSEQRAVDPSWTDEDSPDDPRPNDLTHSNH